MAKTESKEGSRGLNPDAPGQCVHKQLGLPVGQSHVSDLCLPGDEVLLGDGQGREVGGEGDQAAGAGGQQERH